MGGLSDDRRHEPASAAVSLVVTTYETPTPNRPEPTLLELGARVRRLRKDRRLTRQRLSEESGLHYTFVGAIERGERNPTLLTLQKLAQGLGVPLARVVDDVALTSPDEPAAPTGTG